MAVAVLGRIPRKSHKAKASIYSEEWLVISSNYWDNWMIDWLIETINREKVVYWNQMLVIRLCLLSFNYKPSLLHSVLKFQTGKFAECEEGWYWHDLQLAQHVALIGDEGRGFARKKQKMAIIALAWEGGLVILTSLTSWRLLFFNSKLSARRASPAACFYNGQSLTR